MKRNQLKSYIHFLYTAASIATISALTFFGGCSEEDPKKEAVPELITDVTLTFTPTGGGTPVTVTVTDPDGGGGLSVSGPINLSIDKNYALRIQLINGLADPLSAEYDITAEVEEEGDEHMFFFEWTNNVFSSPAGNGNIDNRSDVVNYSDADENGLPIGLQTHWASALTATSGTFHVVLKHQPELKTSMSGSTVGETDLDISFTIVIQ